MQGNMEHRYAIKFCVKLKKTKQEAYGMLKEAYGDEQMSKESFYRWFNRFLKEMNRLRMKPDLEHRTVHVRRKTLRKCEG